jgi:hypothetical protein
MSDLGSRIFLETSGVGCRISDLGFFRRPRWSDVGSRISDFFGDPGVRMSDLGSRIFSETREFGCRISDLGFFVGVPGGSSDRARVF